MKNYLFLLAFAAFLLSSCTGRRYAHYAYVKAEKKPAIARKAPHIKQGLVQSIKKSFIVNTEKPTLPAPPEKLAITARPPKHVKKEAAERHAESKAEKTTQKDDNYKPPYHKGAVWSFVLVVAGVVTAAIIIGLVLMAVGVVKAVKALKETEDPDVYRGRGFAVAAIAIVAVLAALLLVALMVSLLALP